MAKLALLGGKPVRTEFFSQSNTIGEEEKQAVMKVLNSGNLSQFVWLTTLLIALERYRA